MPGGERMLGAVVQNEWSAGELYYLRLVANEILQSEEKSVSSRVALNLTDKVTGNKKKTMELAEKAINKLIEAKWLKMLTDGNIGMMLGSWGRWRTGCWKWLEEWQSASSVGRWW